MAGGAVVEEQVAADVERGRVGGELGGAARAERRQRAFDALRVERATAASCSVREVQLSVPLKVPSPGYSTRYTTPNTTVMMNSHSHQRGSGLFSSRRSSSQTWPVV